MVTIFGYREPLSYYVENHGNNNIHTSRCVLYLHEKKLDLQFEVQDSSAPLQEVMC